MKKTTPALALEGGVVMLLLSQPVYITSESVEYSYHIIDENKNLQH